MGQAIIKQEPVSQEELAGMGSGRVAYIREMNPTDLANYITGDLELDPETNLWVVIAADGTPIALTDSHSAALANLWEAELTAISIH